jgi:hypothetical protein
VRAESEPRPAEIRPEREARSESHDPRPEVRPEREARLEPAPSAAPAEPKTTVAHFEPSAPSTSGESGGGPRQGKPYVVWSSAPSSGGRSSHE